MMVRVFGVDARLAADVREKPMKWLAALDRPTVVALGELTPNPATLSDVRG